MYLDWQFFKDRAAEIVATENIGYRKLTSGTNKGLYQAYIKFPKDIDWENQTKHLISKYGYSIPSRTVHGGYATTEKAKEAFIRDISSYLSEQDRLTHKQYISELFKYYVQTKDNSDIYYAGHIGRPNIDYFKVLLKEVTPENWKGYQFESSAKIGTVTNFKELYWALKNNSKAFWQEYNSYYGRQVKRDYSEFKNFVYDEEKIPEIAQIENSLNEIAEKPKEVKKEITGRIKIEDLENFVPETDNGYIKIGYRKNVFLKTPILLGRERVIVLANREVHGSVFALVELDSIIASHNEVSYADTENYPVTERGGNINDRNYHDDKNAQLRVRQLAEQFNPEVQISTSATAAGLPVITIDGVVVSGNNRMMSMKLMKSNFKDNYTNYLNTLGNEIVSGGYGFDNELLVGTAIRYIAMGGKDEMRSMKKIRVEGSFIEYKNPVLVRIDLDFPEYNTMEMSKYNKDTKKVERPIDKAIKLGKILEGNEACFNNLSDTISKFDNISDFYVSKNDVSNIKNNLVSCGILTTNELPSYIDSGVFTVAGKEFLENLMAGMILGKDQLIVSELEGVKKLKQIIVQSLPVLIKNAKLEAFSVKNNINDAILIQHKVVSSKLDILDLISQFSMFEDKGFNYSEKSLYVNLLLNTGKIKFKKAIETLNASASEQIGESLFGEKVSLDEMFDKIVIPLLDLKTVEAIRKHYQKNGKKEKKQK